jgi:hypothetical protein
VKEVLTRRELFKEMISKDTIKQVAGAWYGFSKPLTEQASQPEKKESLFERIQRVESLNRKKSNETLRKEG